jgi:hypothetical protein
MLTLVTDGRANYATRSRPARLKSVLRGKGVKRSDGTVHKLGIGEFYDEARKIALTQDPNTVPASDGFLRWKSETELQEEAEREYERRQRREEETRLRKNAAEFRRRWLREIGRVRSSAVDVHDIPGWVRAGSKSRARTLDTVLGSALDLLGDFKPGGIESEDDLLRVLAAVAP